MPDYSVAIEPLDPIVFGDNGLGQGTGTGSDLNVFPTTLHGALGGLILKACGGPRPWPTKELGPRHDDILRPLAADGLDLVAASAQLRGYCFSGLNGNRWFTRPQHFPIKAAEIFGKLSFNTVGTPDQVERNANVRSSNGYSHLISFQQPLDEYEGDLLIDESLMKNVLCDHQTSGVLKTGVTRPQDLLVRDQSRPGIAIDDDTGRTVDGQLFVRGLRRFSSGSVEGDKLSAGYEAWLRTPGKLREFGDCTVGKLGGDGRRANMTFSTEDNPLGDLKDAVINTVKAKKTRGFLLYLLTPAIFEAGAVHYLGAPPIAAALGKTWRYSGWNTKLGEPRPFVTMVPAGSVYYFEWPENKSAVDVINEQWLESIPQVKSAQDPIEPAIAGFGRALVGVWS